MYQNYIFDLYGTLIDIHTNENKAKIWKNLQKKFLSYDVVYLAKDIKERYESLCAIKQKKLQNELNIDDVEIELLEVFDELFNEKNITLTKDELLNVANNFRKDSTEYIKLYPHVITLLETLKDKGKKIYLLSNAQSCFTNNEILSLGLYSYFDGIILSSNEKVKKPSVLFFNKLRDRYQIDKSKSVMIGNEKESDILGAINYNIDSIYIFSNLSPKKDMKSNIKATKEINMENMLEIVKDVIL